MAFLLLFIAIIGGLIFWLTEHPKAGPLAKDVFWVSLLAFLLTYKF